jgi:hypothetical protein
MLRPMTGDEMTQKRRRRRRRRRRQMEKTEDEHTRCLQHIVQCHY